MNFIRKCIYISLIGFFPLLVYANYPYVGFGIGYDVTDFYKHLTIRDETSNLYNKKDNQTGTGFYTDALIGYQWNFDKMFFATEVSTGLSKLKYHGYYVDKENKDASRATYTIDKSYGISVLPGYFIQDNIGLYAHLGLIRGNFKYAEYKDDESKTNVGVTEKKWLNGIKYGIGVLLPLKEQLKMRLEYSHIQYQTYTNKTFPIEPNKIRTIKLTPASNQVELKLIYVFD